MAAVRGAVRRRTTRCSCDRLAEMSERATSFGAEAAAYDAVRPHYPDAVVHRIVAGAPDLVVDAGCGTGIAAAQVAALGVRVLGVEPDARMAAVAAGRGIEVICTRFEGWDPEACDVVMSAQAWHWVDPVIGARVAAAAIRPGGRWIACWNHVVDGDVDAVVRSVYERLAPVLIDDRPASYAGDPAFRERIEVGLDTTRAFAPMEVDRVDWADGLTGRRLAARLGSHSAHLALDPALRRQVFAALVDELGADRPVDVAYVTEVFTATRVDRKSVGAPA